MNPAPAEDVVPLAKLSQRRIIEYNAEALLGDLSQTSLKYRLISHWKKEMERTGAAVDHACRTDLEPSRGSRDKRRSPRAELPGPAPMAPGTGAQQAPNNAPVADGERAPAGGPHPTTARQRQRDRQRPSHAQGQGDTRGRKVLTRKTPASDAACGSRTRARHYAASRSSDKKARAAFSANHTLRYAFDAERADRPSEARRT